MMPYAVTALLTAQAALLALDVWDLGWRHSAGSRALRRLSVRAVAFLVVVSLAYLAVQLLGSWLSPQPARILAGVRGAFLDRAPPSDEPLGVRTSIILAVVLFYVAGFWDYAVHRFFSHHPWFWCTHEYHHLPRIVSVFMPGILVRPFAFIPNVLTVLGTAITLCGSAWWFGLPPWDLQPLLPVLLLVVLVLTASHSAFLRRQPFVHRALRLACLTTPQEHVLHHAVHLQGNYGNFTTLWDRVCGTYLDPSAVDLDKLPLGLAYDQDFLGALTAGRWKLSRHLRRRYQVGRFCRLTPRRSESVGTSAGAVPVKSDVAVRSEPRPSERVS